MLNLEEELRRVIEAFEGEGIPYAVAGGVAVSIYTTPRATEDIDLLISAADLDRARPALQALGFQRGGPPMNVAQGKLRIQRLTKIAGSDLLPLDLLLADSSPVDGVLRTRQRLDWGARHIWVVSIEGLRTLKRLRGARRARMSRPTLTRSVTDTLTTISALRRLCLALPHAPTPLDGRQLERFQRLCQAAAPLSDGDIDALRTGLRHCWRNGEARTFRDVAARIPAELLGRDRWLQSFVVAARAFSAAWEVRAAPD